MNRFLVVATVVAGSFIGTATMAFAQEQNLSSTLAVMDKNKDGKITLSEWDEIRSRPPAFRRFDLNADGVLDQAELKTMQESRDRYSDRRGHGRHDGGCMFWD